MGNKYYDVLNTILRDGKRQQNKKGGILFLINVVLKMSPENIDQIFKEHPVAKKKLAAELELYMQGVTTVSEYQANGILWWDYCAPELINSYPTYFGKLPALIDKINTEKRSSKNYVLFIGETGKPTNQLPCLSLIQFQISCDKLHMTVYQRSADSSLGLPSDIYQMLLVSKKIDVPLGSITFFIGNAHIYDNNLKATRDLLDGESNVKFALNV